MKNEIMNAHNSDDIFNAIRPGKLKDFIGQENIKKNLDVFITSTLKRSDTLDHVILHGPPGLGKTTLAQIISKELGVNFKATSGPVITKIGDLAAILTNLEANDVLFIDEIHRLNKNIEEVLYSAMEDYNLDLIIGEGPAARTVKIDLPKFTLIGATTRIGLLSAPLRDRFGIPLRLDFYDHKNLDLIVKRAAKIDNHKMDPDASTEIAKRSRGTPRIALRLLRRVRDYSEYLNKSSISKDTAIIALKELEIDSLGLDSLDHKYLNYLINNYNGGPVGIDTICAGLSEERDTIEESVEPYLLQIGFINRTPRGRLVTSNGYHHFGLEPSVLF